MEINKKSMVEAYMRYISQLELDISVLEKQWADKKVQIEICNTKLKELRK